LFWHFQRDIVGGRTFRDLQNYKPLFCVNDIGNVTHFQMKSYLFNGRSQLTVVEIAKVAPFGCRWTLGVGFGDVREPAALSNGTKQFLGLRLRLAYLGTAKLEGCGGAISISLRRTCSGTRTQSEESGLEL
jgi:hypothetical protein